MANYTGVLFPASPSLQTATITAPSGSSGTTITSNSSLVTFVFAEGTITLPATGSNSTVITANLDANAIPPGVTTGTSFNPPSTGGLGFPAYA